MDLKDTIIKQLSAPVKRKGTQDYMTGEEDITEGGDNQGGGDNGGGNTQGGGELEG